MPNPLGSRYMAMDRPQPDGERLVSWLRLFLAFAMIGIQVAYFNMISPPVWRALTVSIVFDAIWAAMAVGYLVFSSQRSYRPWMSYATTVFDVAIVLMMQLALTTELPLSFINGPIKFIAFIMIGLAALRRSSRLVEAAGLMSAVSHIVISTVGYLENVPDGTLVAEINGIGFQLTIVDEAGFAMILVMVSWLVGTVTRNLRHSERHYQDLFEHLPDGIAITNAAREILDANRRFADMAGLPKDALVGRDIRPFLGTAAQGRASLVQGSAEAPTALIRANEEEIPVRTLTVPIRYRGEQCFETSFRDVTEHIKLERQLARTQKMETIGKLAGGLAHDFNNILGGILGAGSLLTRTISKIEDEPTRKKMETQLKLINECGEQARNVVSRLRTFSDTQTIETAPVNLDTLTRDVATICRNTFGRGVSIRVESDDESLVVMGDATSLSQALLNLCINARDAMNGMGALTISVALVDTESSSLASHPEADPGEEYCLISVRDSGVGMSEKTMNKVFDPFFTTKPPGEGTGLGLSMVYTVAKQHGGFLDVTSQVGEGSCFYLYLTKARESLLPTATQEQRLPKGSGRVLVLDDDKIVRATVKGMLEELGYTVTVSVSGDRGKESLHDQADELDVVLMDMTLPHRRDRQDPGGAAHGPPQVEGHRHLRLRRLQIHGHPHRRRRLRLPAQALHLHGPRQDHPRRPALKRLRC